MEKNFFHNFIKSDEEIIAYIRKNNPDALNYLYHRYLPLIRSLRPQIDSQMIEDDDFYQEALICLHRCAAKYNGRRRVTFGAFYKRALQNHYIDLVRKQMALKRKANYRTYPIMLSDTEDGGEEGSIIASNTVYEAPESYTLLTTEIKVFLQTLKQEDRQLITLFISGYSVTAIAKEMELPEAVVKRRIGNCRGKLKNHLYNHL